MADPLCLQAHLWHGQTFNCSNDFVLGCSASSVLLPNARQKTCSDKRFDAAMCKHAQLHVHLCGGKCKAGGGWRGGGGTLQVTLML